MPPSSTPPRANVSAHASTRQYSTPNSRGGSAVSNHIGLLGVNVNNVRPWIERDIEQAQTCPVDDMLRLFLQRASHKPEAKQPDLLQKCLKEVVRVLNKRPDADRFHPSCIKEALDSFASERIETTSYGPFVEASNIALKCLAGLKVKGMIDAPSDLDIICQVNDYPIHQDHQGRTSKRKPDVVILPFKCAKGRATNVFPVTSKKLAKDNPEIAKDGMVAKVFWAEEQRTSEPDILKKVYEIAEEQDAVKGHVPHLLWHHKFKDPTSKIREALGVSEPAKGSRVLFILVFRKLRPITELKGTEFFDAWRQCIMCHYALWQAGVYHRDVSPGNMMWYRNGTILMGVLNDYDLSSLATAQGPQGNERTGTIPFMALDLLNEKGQRGEVKHLYRHDLESFMWVLVWVSLRYKDGQLLPRKSRPFDKWATVDAETCGEKKSFFQTNSLEYRSFAMDQRMWDLVIDCFLVLETDTYRRKICKLKQERQQPGADGQIVAEKIELDDLEFLNLFTRSDAWVQLSNSVQ